MGCVTKSQMTTSIYSRPSNIWIFFMLVDPFDSYSKNFSRRRQVVHYGNRPTRKHLSTSEMKKAKAGASYHDEYILTKSSLCYMIKPSHALYYTIYASMIRQTQYQIPAYSLEVGKPATPNLQKQLISLVF